MVLLALWSVKSDQWHRLSQELRVCVTEQALLLHCNYLKQSTASDFHPIPPIILGAIKRGVGGGQ